MTQSAPEALPKAPLPTNADDPMPQLGRGAKAADTETPRSVRMAAVVMAVAFALMALFNSAGLKSYARDLPDGWFADAAIRAADRWHAAMEALGSARVEPAARAALERLRKVSW